MTISVTPLGADEAERHARPLPDAGLGALDTGRGNLPLDSVELRAAITGLTTRIDLAQGFRNPHDEPLEATYIFPLPDRAAVTALRMEADGRTVEGRLQERGQARATYDAAVASGRRASIAEQDRPDVFTLRVGTIMPGERVVVRLSLAGLLPYEDGAATFRFPLVVAPRYIPGAPLPGADVGDGVAADTDAVPDASRITPPVLLPGFPTPVRLTAVVDVDPAGLPRPQIRSSLDAAVTSPDGGDGRVRVELAPGQRLDRDFVLRLGFSGGGTDEPHAPVAALAVRADGEGASGGEAGQDEGASGVGTFALTLVPPVAAGQARPRDVVLLLDRSGSMGGWKMVAARRAAARIVDSLGAADRLAVFSFDHTVERPPQLPTGLVPATDRHRFRAVEHLAGLDARGGTEILAPLRQALDLFAADAPDAGAGTRRERVLVLVTDGQVGNEQQILTALAAGPTGVRVHTVGVDTAVNASFLRSLAAVGGGRCELVESEDRLDEAMRAIHRRIGSPLVTDLRIESAGLDLVADTAAPSPLPDLFADAPVVVTGRFRGETAGAVTVVGRGLDGAEWRQTLPATPSNDGALGAVWARARIRDLEDHYSIGRGNNADLEQRITAVSLRFGVLSRFTAFVAVDDRVVNEGGRLHHVTQPVELPHGWGVQADATAWMGAVAPAAPGGAAPAGGYAPVAARRMSAPRMAAAPTPPPPGASAPPAPGGPPVNPSRPRMVPYDGDDVDVPDFLATGSDRPVAPSAPAAPWSAAAPAPDLRLPADLLAFLRAAAQALRATADAPFDDRVAWLATLATDITARLDALPAATRTAPWARLLRDLAAELSAPLDSPAELHHRWLRVGDVLDGLTDGAATAPADEAGQRRRRDFWKR